MNMQPAMPHAVYILKNHDALIHLWRTHDRRDAGAGAKLSDDDKKAVVDFWRRQYRGDSKLAPPVSRQSKSI